VTLARLCFAALLGRRPPRLRGTLTLPGLQGRVTIRRDRHGVPHVDASNDADAWFGLGFCLGQDRAFQLELLLRAARGTVAELVGPQGLAVDRFSRRVGFRRAAERQLAALDADVRAMVAVYAAGVNAGARDGRRRRPHEFTLLRARPTPWSEVDVVASFVLLGDTLGSPWDTQLARLRVALADGPDAVAALEPTYPPGQPVASPPGARAGEAADRLARDLRAFRAVVAAGAGSNSWALAAARTATGRPLLANDTHLPTVVPSQWYLAHLRTPEWEVAGASFVGGPAFGAGHNGFCAWGTTLAFVDNADLFVEEVGPDGRSVRDGDAFVPCEVHEEAIAVRRAEPVVERVLETPRGPIVAPAADGEPALSLRAAWLDPGPRRGLLELPRVRSLDDFRAAFASWAAPSLNLVYADRSGTIAWQLVGDAPRRDDGGMLPRPGWSSGRGWPDGMVGFEELPHVADPAEGFVASANAKPAADGPYLGSDWLDGYRMERIVGSLRARSDWTRAASTELQLDDVSLVWRELRDTLLAAAAVDGDAATALELLRRWDGRVRAGSAAASVYELAFEELVQRTIAAKAPNSARWARGVSADPLRGESDFVLRRTSHLVRLLREQPAGWMARPWSEEIGHALSAAVRTLRERRGDDRSEWDWGSVRPLTLVHPIAARATLARVFNIGPLPGWGDGTTVAQAGIDPVNPLAKPLYIPVLRMNVDVGDWEQSRFAICGGQSGNPASRHYDDQVPAWQSGAGIPIAWSEASVARATDTTLTLRPDR
jgi:penicillin G amidase